MPKTTGKVPAYPSNLGLDQSSIPGAQDPRSMWDCDSIIFTVNATRKKFWGLKQFYKQGFQPLVTRRLRGVFDYWRNNNGVQEHKNVAFVGGKMLADSADGIFNDVTGAAVLFEDDHVCFETFFGILIVCFENSPPLSWTMAGNMDNFDAVCFAAHGQHLPSYDVVTNPNPIFKYCRVFQQKLWLAGNPTAPHRIYYSSTGDPTDWRIVAPGNAGSIDLDVGDSDPVGITAIFPPFYESLYVGKRKSIYKIDLQYSADLGDTLFTATPTIKGIGCIEHNSVVATPHDIIWASDRGVHSLVTTDKAGDVEASFLSLPIHEAYRKETSFFAAKNMWAVFDPHMNSYLLAMTKRGQSTNKHLWCYNITLNQWYQRKNFDCATVSSFVDSKSATRTLVGRESALNLALLDEDITSDYGVGKPMYFVTPTLYPAGRADLCWNFKKLWLFFRPQTTGFIKVAYQIDMKGVTVETVPMTWTDTSAFASMSAASSTGSIIGYFFVGAGIIGGLGTGSISGITGGTGGGLLKEIPVPLMGSGHGLQLAFLNEANPDNPDEDCEIYGFIVEAEAAEDSDIPTIS